MKQDTYLCTQSVSVSSLILRITSLHLSSSFASKIQLVRSFTTLYSVRDTAVMPPPNSPSGTALDKLSVGSADDRLQDSAPAQYQSFCAALISGCWRRMMFCRSGILMQRLLLFAVVLTTFLTWNGYRLQHRPLGMWRKGVVSFHSRWRAMLYQCTQMSSTVEPDHPNPCWTVELPLGCEENCQHKKVCAPKIIVAGVNGCYSTRLLSPFTTASGVLMVNDRVETGGMCPLEYLTHNYQEGLLGEPEEPTLYLNDPQLITSSIGASQSDLPLGGKTRWLSGWLHTSSRIVVVLCDPTFRLLRHIHETMVMTEPTKEAVHNYIIKRINKAQMCIKEHGAKGCQKMDLGDDTMYSYLLQGIYLPYMTDLRDHLPSQFINPLYVNYINSTAYSLFISELSQVLSTPQDMLNQQELEDIRVQEAETVQNVMHSIRPETLQAIQTFYASYRKDLSHILSMYA